MTTPEVISAISSTVAVLSLAFNIIQYKLNRKNVANDRLLTQNNMAKDDLKTTLRGLLTRLEYTQFFTVPYHAFRTLFLGL